MAKVLGLVSFRIFPTHMGGQKGVALFYKYLQRHIQLLLAVSTDNVETQESPIKRSLYPNKKIYLNFFKIRKLEHLMRSENVDLIIAEHSYTGWIAWQLHKKTGKPFLIHSHNIESKRFAQMHKWWWKIYRSYEGFIHRKAQHSFFISNEDLAYAVSQFKLVPSKCSVITYGIEIKNTEREKAKLPDIRQGEAIFLFNGTLDYQPNYDAVLHLIDDINPLLQQRINNYRIVVTGNRAPRQLIQKMLGCPQLSYVGYAEDVNLYYRAADLFLNPLANDTGVKTKLIEAIANHCTAISTEAGAAGMCREVCGKKLITTADRDWTDFAEKIIAHYNQPQPETPQAFFDHYDWEHISLRAAKKIQELI